VINPQQPGQLDLGVDFFEAFPRRGVRRVFVVIDETAGQAPQAVARLDRTSSKHDTTVDLHDHGGCDLGVTPQDEAVVGTGFDLATVDDSRHQRGAAVDTEVTH